MAKSVFDLCSHRESTPPTTFYDPAVHAAKIEHFVIHSVTIDEGVTIIHGFAVVDWLLCHPLRHIIGKPFQIWCNSVHECSPRNFIIPLENISSIALTANYVVQNESILVTIPLL